MTGDEKFLIEKDFVEKIQGYISEHYDIESRDMFGERPKDINIFEEFALYLKKKFSGFSKCSDFYYYLAKFMKEKNLTEAEVIQKTHLPENAFEILRSYKYINFTREAVLGVCVTLKLDLNQTNMMLDFAVCNYLYADSKRDTIIAFFIENKVGDVFLLNETLEYFNLRNLNDKKNFSDEVTNLIEPIDDYVKKNYVSTPKFSYSGSYHAEKIEKIIEQREKNFSEYLLEFIREKNMSEVEVYKKAHLNRRIFSKLRNEENYKPSKKTILAISFGMELKLSEVEELLKHGGYALSLEDKFDLIMRYFFENQIYDLFLVNEVLDYYEFKPISD